jgi:uncharacterized protein
MNASRLRRQRVFSAPRLLMLMLTAAALITVTCVLQPATAATQAATSARTPWPGGRWQPDPVQYGQELVADQPIVTSDGVTLRADVYYPTDPSTGQRAPGRFPVILAQTPYNCSTPQSAAVPYNTSYFVDRGYIFVIACLRGTGRSGGTFDLLDPREASDGVRLVEWAAHQLPGSDGLIGGNGCSYVGITQLMTAAALGPNSPLKTIIPAGVSADELYRELFYSWGMPTDFTTIGAPEALAEMGPRGVAWGEQNLPNMLGGGSLAYDGPYWQQRTVANYVVRAAANHIPALIWLGWNDLVTSAGPNVYSEYQNVYTHRPALGPMSPGQRATGDAQLVVGPWSHCEGVSDPLELEWYDTWLKHEPTGMADTTTPIHAYENGAKTWINTSDYPMVAKYTRYYLNSGGTLTTATPASSSTAALTYAQPQPSVPGTMVTYTSAPLPDGATLSGPVSASIYASSSGRNLSLIATLEDVAPDGTVTDLTTGNVVGSLRALDQQRNWYDQDGVDIRPYGTFAADSYLTPGQPELFQFTLRPVVATVAPGDSLRVVVTTQTPDSVCTGWTLADSEAPCAPTPQQTQTLPGTYTLLADPRMPSAINLPVLPYNYFASAGNGPEPLDWGTP